ncbi:MAG: helix-turn-helix domain-containing protein [Anaerolineae bacterium]
MKELIQAEDQDDSEASRNEEAIDMYLQGLKVTDICRALTRSRSWFYETLKRYQQGGQVGLKSKSPSASCCA